MILIHRPRALPSPAALRRLLPLALIFARVRWLLLLSALLQLVEAAPLGLGQPHLLPFALAQLGEVRTFACRSYMMAGPVGTPVRGSTEREYLSRLVSVGVGAVGLGVFVIV
jgi:hypothetical protein